MNEKGLHIYPYYVEISNKEMYSLHFIGVILLTLRAHNINTTTNKVLSNTIQFY